jgi:hypothetical protein
MLEVHAVGSSGFVEAFTDVIGRAAFEHASRQTNCLSATLTFLFSVACDVMTPN